MSFILRRTFATSSPLRNAATEAVAPVKKPVGAFRGGIFGFLLGSTVTGTASYFYIYEEYKLANDLLTEDIDALRSSTQRLEMHLRALEEKVADQAAKAKK
ncbi:hypothetical protein FPQ18DRAFT_256212 [Pyronema domesticum]|uniref:Uncharacterized protein n=1 Tax=Pyronema omphalodes (strain CBS 100304) TaxID=1076935 RepID=U4LLS4_PYROM|nr:hypothetical protein FPQ18DRAFT_256212 [Pyronema domesticum]CCX32542.1 Similar to hypothetical protein LEMA_P098800.1 [Leptosphaeria maculans JN3]; acc. no. CBX98471 [Pyronema omphalodes CBS 100304]